MHHKLVILSILFLLSYNMASAQSPAQVAWDVMIGGNDYEQKAYVLATADSGFLLYGHTISFQDGDKTEPSYGWTDIWIIKYDKFHTQQWQRSYGGDEYEDAIEAIQLPDGGFIIVCTSESGISGTKTDSSRGMLDIWLIRTDALGNQVWDKTIGGNDNDIPKYFHRSPNGNFLLGARSRSSVSGEKTEICRGSDDYWVMEIDTSGFIIWQKTIGGGSSDIIIGVLPMLPNGFFLLGESQSGISGDKTTLGGNQMWCVKLDSSGTTITHQFSQGTQGYNFAPACALPKNGSTVIVGSSSGVVKEMTFTGVVVDYLMLDAASCPSPSNPLLSIKDIAKTPDGGYLIGFHTNLEACGNYKTENCKGSRDYWVVKLDSSYNKMWDKTVGTLSNDYLYSVCANLNGEILLAGIALPDISGDLSNATAFGFNYWVVSIDNKINTLTGNIYADLNSNGIRDTTEPDLPQIKVTNPVTNDFTYTDHQGNFQLHTRSTNYVEINADSLNYFTTVPSTNNATFTGYQELDSLNDFSFQPMGVMNDLNISITPLNNFRNNFISYYAIEYNNCGTTTISNPVISFYPDTSLTFISSIPPASTITADSITWDLTTLDPFDGGIITIAINVNLGTANGTPVNSSATIFPVSNDADPASNYSQNIILVTGSFDPNNMFVTPDTILTSQMINPPILDYIINFQNEGNDTAFNISVHTKIPNELDLNTFKLVGSSHLMNIEFEQHSRYYKFNFPNILLPDEDTNEPLSHGYVRYSIRPVTPMTSFGPVATKAEVFFDFNEPVMTDTVKVYIVTPVNISGFQNADKNVNLIPNPVSEILTIKGSGFTKKNISVEIVNVFGQPASRMQIARDDNNGFRKTIDLSFLQAGVYFVTVTEGNEKVVSKIVKL